jgi:hypothetical protein
MRGMSASSLGVADLPMRLLIASVVMSITVPIVWSAYSDLSVKNTVVSIEREIRDIFEIIEDVMDGGVGSTLEARMEISSWGTARVEELAIGGRLNGSNGSERFLISYHISGYGSRFMSLDPPVPILSIEGINLGEGIYSLKITHALSDDGHYCHIEVI